MGTLRVCVSASAGERVDAARRLLGDSGGGARVLVLGASRGAADDLARDVAATRQATFGIERLSLIQLAARHAIVALAAGGAAPGTPLGAEAVATRAVFGARSAEALDYFGPVAGTPGFPRALARTLHELRLARVNGAALARLPLGGGDLSDLLERFESSFLSSATVDRVALFEIATREMAGRPVADAVVLLDVPVDHPAERSLVATVVAGASVSLATVPHGDRDAVAFFQSLGGVVEERVARGDGDLDSLRRFLFESVPPPQERALDGSLEFFSAPGEGRESVEIARRVLREARRGVRFDQMAILVRAPHAYFGLLEHALARATVPAWFDRGTRRPHPAGRAFLALLACAADQLSASRFAEYLSLGQVPNAPGAQRPEWEPADEDGFGRTGERAEDDAAFEERMTGTGETDRDAVLGGTVRAPWRWEELLVESAVIGRDAGRWRRRLDGKDRELALQITEADSRDGGDEARVAVLRQVREQLGHLRAFALPVIERLAGWPRRATWGEWLDAFEALIPHVLRMPAHVLRVLSELRPMADVGPLDLDEVRRVLAERLLTVQSLPASRRFGRVYVGTPDQARGRSFRVVFVPGLAERVFPQKPREDPLMLDTLRLETGAPLARQKDRLHLERLRLQLAVGAATERLYVSYPRIELSESRARVPSFYALDIMRAATGRVPDPDVLEERAREAGSATLAWPAPSAPDDAIDDQEHDLAVLRRLLDEPDASAVRGHAHYLLKLNEPLRRSIVDRWARGERRWSASDGLTRVSPHTQAALSAQRLTARPYSLSALQRFSACPYQFVLAAMYRLQPLEAPEPLQRMDPLTRGSLFHAVQARFFRALAARGGLPVTASTLAAAMDVLDEAIDLIAREAYDQLAPAVERVWEDEIAGLRRDLHGWLQRLAGDGDEWLPTHFEYAFGAVPGERDANSRQQDVTLEGGFRLRGAVDLIEEHRQTTLLRVTDHKTGRRPDRIADVIVGGGAVLQPVLYALAVESALQRPVAHGRLFYCTAAGGFHPHVIVINERSRAAGLEALQVIDRAIERGFLAAAPTEDACGRCDFRRVCGPDVFRRVRQKPQEPLSDLQALRSRP